MCLHVDKGGQHIHRCLEWTYMLVYSFIKLYSFKLHIDSECNRTIGHSYNIRNITNNTMYVFDRIISKLVWQNHVQYACVYNEQRINKATQYCSYLPLTTSILIATARVPFHIMTIKENTNAPELPFAQIVLVWNNEEQCMLLHDYILSHCAFTMI